MKHTRLFLVACLPALLLIPSLANGNSQSAKATGHATDMDSVSPITGETLDSENVFYDDFTSGISSSTWAISERKWGNEYNSGVRHENVLWTGNKAVFRALGGYYQDAEFVNNNEDAYTTDGSYTGGAIISKDEFGPGRYEIKMKVAPIPGICSAMWIYNVKNDAYSEIDIEFPNRTYDDVNEVNVYSFDEMICSTYTGTEEGEYSSEKATLSSYVNDGEYHTFAFEWYYSGSNKTVRWYCDGQFIKEIDTNVSEYYGHLWIGCWIPNNQYFVGQANFDKAYMSVDYVKYTPFTSQIATPLNTSLSETSNIYPSRSYIEYDNFVPNTAFAHNTFVGFTKTGDAEFSKSYNASSDDTYGLRVYQSSLAASTVEHTTFLAGMENLKFSCKFKGYGEVSLSFYSANNTKLGDGYKLINASWQSSYTLGERDVVVPNGTVRAVVQIYTESDAGVYVDDLFLGYEYENTQPSSSASYGFTTQNNSQTAEGWGEKDVCPDGDTAKPWRLIGGNYWGEESNKVLVLNRSYALCDADGSVPLYAAIKSCMDANNAFNIDEETGNRMPNGAIIQQFDLDYFSDIEVCLKVLAGSQPWLLMHLLYSTDSGSSWNVLKRQMGPLEASSDATYKYSFKATSADLGGAAYSTIRFAFVGTLFGWTEDATYNISAITINKLNQFKNMLDSNQNCSANAGYKGYLQHIYSKLSSAEIDTLNTEEMKNYTQSYITGYNYLLNHWGVGMGTRTSHFVQGDNQSMAIIIVSLLITSIASFTLLLVTKRKIKGNK